MAPARRRAVAVLLGVVVVVAAVAVVTVLLRGGDDTDPPVLRVDQLDEAIAAVEEVQGPDVAFFEVNATPDLVNLFVRTEAADGSSTATS